MKLMLLPLALLALTACTGKTEQKPLLSGTVNLPSPVEVSVSYDYEGDTYETKFMVEPYGTFEYYDSVFIPDASEVQITIDGMPHGAYLSKGKTVEMNIHPETSFSGDNVDASRFFDSFYQAYDYMDFKPTPDRPYNYEQWNERLTTRTDDIRALIPSVQEELQDGLADLVNSTYGFYRILTLKMDENDHSAEIDSIIGTVDPDKDSARKSYIISYWFEENRRGRIPQMTDYDTYVANSIRLADSLITNPGNKKYIWLREASPLLTSPMSDERLNAFFDSIAPQLEKAPQIKEKMMQMQDAVRPKVGNGDPIPSDPVLIDPEGNRVHLSDLLGNEIVYIDIWATWCAPCCAEIPHLEKLVEEMKDNRNIRFISISWDENRDAWLEKLGRDKPSWPNYIFEKSSGDKFMADMGILGIPRFLLVGKDSRFINTNELRPSKGVLKVLEEASR